MFTSKRQYKIGFFFRGKLDTAMLNQHSFKVICFTSDSIFKHCTPGGISSFHAIWHLQTCNLHTAVRCRKQTKCFLIPRTSAATVQAKETRTSRHITVTTLPAGVIVTLTGATDHGAVTRALRVTTHSNPALRAVAETCKEKDQKWYI